MSLPTHLTLEIVTPDRALVTEDVDEVQLPGTEGYLGILPGHTPLLTSLRVGQVWYRKGADIHYLSVAFGFAEVLPDRVRLLARIANAAQHLHGGIGVDVDYPIHRYFLWSKSLELTLGSAAPHLARLGRILPNSLPAELA